MMSKWKKKWLLKLKWKLKVTKNERLEKPFKSECQNRFAESETYYAANNRIFDYDVLIKKSILRMN